MSLDDYTIVLYRQDGGWVAELPSLPGAYALMPTREEALAELRETAVGIHVRSPDSVGLRAGTTVEFELVDRGVVLRKGRKGGARPVDRVRGILPGRGATDVLIDDLRGPVPAAWKRRR